MATQLGGNRKVPRGALAAAKRNKRIYIDYLRNGRGTTAIGAYSPRAREGFPLAAPVTWAQVERRIRPNAFTIARFGAAR